MRQAGGWHGGKVLPPRGKTAPVTGPAGRTEQGPRWQGLDSVIDGASLRDVTPAVSLLLLM